MALLLAIASCGGGGSSGPSDSSDSAIVIESSRLVQTFPACEVRGTAFNRSGRTLGVLIQFAAFDRSGTAIGTASAIIQTFPPGRAAYSAPFVGNDFRFLNCSQVARFEHSRTTVV